MVLEMIVGILWIVSIRGGVLGVLMVGAVIVARFGS